MPRSVVDARVPAGWVRSVNLKPQTPGERGIPKRPVERAVLTPNGLSGDFNRDRHEEHHDDLSQAVVLLPLETLRDLAAEGWPVLPGDLGENVTTEGIPYAVFAPGTRWVVGAATVEVSRPCDPCELLYGLPYVGTRRGSEFLKTTLGRRGWYARVLRGGEVRPGDAVVPVR